MEKLCNKIHVNLKFVLRIAIISCLSFSLSGCGNFPNATNKASSTSSPVSTTKSSADEASTVESPAPRLDETNPIYKACNELVSIESLYDFNPNYSYDASASPEKGSLFELAINKAGTYCAYSNLSSGELIEISVANIPDQSLESWKQKISETNRASDKFNLSPADFAFFSRNNNEGVAQVISGNYWIVISSKSFYSEEDAVSLVSVVTHSLAG